MRKQNKSVRSFLKTYSSKAILGTILFLLSLNSIAQEQEFEPPIDREIGRRSLPARLYGKVVDSKSNKGVEAASVQVFIQKIDSASGTKSDSLIAGMLTKPNGDFTFFNLPLPDSFVVKISAIGYSENVQNVVMEQAAREAADPERDLGNIKIANEADFLGAVTVVAQRPALQMGIDRKIFNVDKSLTSTGGTAIDVMRNIPSVTVDADGNVQLRNTSPQIFVDGRPTILTLQQIPADDIERVELITNPSAKFDAASTGGIINVILKKNRRFGLNGIASAGIGTPDIRTASLSLNLRQGKFNFFGSGNYNQSGGVARSETMRQNKIDGIRQDYFFQESENERSRRFTSVRFGLDYFLDNRNTISISQNFVKGRFSNIEDQDQRYLNYDKVLQRTGDRIADGRNQFNRSNTQVNYRHNFPKSGQELTADITYNRGTGENLSLITNTFYSANGTMENNPNIVRNRGNNNNDQVTVQVDYVNPINETSKIEMGLRTFTNNNASILNAFAMNNGGEVKLPLSTNVKYDETVHAAYVTYTNKWKSIRYQVGFRGEYSKFEGELVDSARTFGYTIPIDLKSIFDGLFPSIYLSKEIGEGQELQLNFSRRIRRPSFWQLNPFIDINDPLNISQGNPAVRPEYLNRFEFNYSKQYSTGSFLGVLYFTNNQGDITRYSDTISSAQYQQLNNAAIDPNAILNTFINAQFTNRMGAEFTLQHRIGNLELIPNINLQYRKVKATVGDLDLDNEGFNWEGKLIINYKLTSKKALLNNTNFQLMGEYESREAIPQGFNKEQYVIDFAIRKEFLKDNKAAITFAINDVLDQRRFGQIYDTDNFYQDSYRRWNVRNFRMTFTYRFGDKDFNLFGRGGGRGAEGGRDDD